MREERGEGRERGEERREKGERGEKREDGRGEGGERGGERTEFASLLLSGWMQIGQMLIHTGRITRLIFNGMFFTAVNSPGRRVGLIRTL